MNTLPAQLRQLLRPLLPEQAFLRRARGDATFITNAPLFAEVSLDSHGFLCTRQDKLLLISPGPEFIAAFERNPPIPPIISAKRCCASADKRPVTKLSGCSQLA